MDLYQQYRAMSPEILKATLARGKLDEHEEKICREVLNEKTETPVADSSVPDTTSTGHATEDISDYKTGIAVARLMSFAGWLVVIGGVIYGGFLLYQGAGMFQYARGETIFLMIAGILGSALGVMLTGLMLVIAGQAARAVMDNANFSRKMYLQSIRISQC